MPYSTGMADKPQSTFEEIVDGITTDILDSVEVRNNLVLCGIWMRPQKTKGGVILTDKALDEDVWQGKVLIVLKKGPQAFKDDARIKFDGQDALPGDMIVAKVSDSFQLDLNGVHCRFIEDVRIVANIGRPEAVY